MRAYYRQPMKSLKQAVKLCEQVNEGVTGTAQTETTPEVFLICFLNNMSLKTHAPMKQVSL